MCFRIVGGNKDLFLINKITQNAQIIFLIKIKLNVDYENNTKLKK